MSFNITDGVKSGDAVREKSLLRSDLFIVGDDQQVNLLKKLDQAKGSMPDGFPALAIVDDLKSAAKPVEHLVSGSASSMERQTGGSASSMERQTAGSASSMERQTGGSASSMERQTGADGPKPPVPKVPDRLDIAGRMEFQEDRILKGVIDHTLSDTELTTLIQGEAAIQKSYFDAMRDGKLNDQEKKALADKLDITSKQIYDLEHNQDGHGGGGGGGGHGGGGDGGHGGGGDGGHGGGGDGGGKPKPGQPAPTSVDNVIARQNAANDKVLPGLGAAEKYHKGWGSGAFDTGFDLSKHPEAKTIVPWGWIYPEKGKEANPNAQVSVSNRDLWALKKDGTWEKISPPAGPIWHAEEEMSNLKHRYSEPVKVNPDGSFTMNGLTPGRLQEFDYSMGKYDTSKYLGIYSSLSIKSDVPNSGLVVQLGADAYGDNRYLKGIGTSNWTEITNTPQTLSYTNLSADLLRRYPPPGASA